MGAINNNRLVYDWGLGTTPFYKGSKTNPATYQWSRFSTYEPGGVGRTPADNPEFLWPANQYMDIAGNTQAVQRGYMRSLVTDPAFNLTGKTAPNRRLFFQFNPTVLVRSVQQTVGAMNPLLQDPVQLTQPVPGTATFGFELLFNREHEVASGKIETGYDLPSLPDGSLALPSKVGVLADILVLDAITGQGISKDLIEILTAQTQVKTENYITSAEADLTDSDEDKQLKKEFEKTKAALNTIQDQYNINIGNQAFLNPLPFRVLFSSLFMVEGVATSVDVQFQKFNKNMVPTQCKVTINMYALYIGFAKKDTFLTKNLEESAKASVEKDSSSDAIVSALKYALSEASYDFLKSDFAMDDITRRVSAKIIAKQSNVFKNIVKQKSVVKDVKVTMSMRYKLAPTSTTKYSFEELSETSVMGYKDGKKSEGNLDTIIDTGFWDGGSEVWNATEIGSAFAVEAGKATIRQYISIAIVISLTSGTGTVSIQMPVIDGIQWHDGDYKDFTVNDIKWVNPNQYETGPG